MATYENGAVYEGDFRKDHRWGWGRQRFPDGSVYEGEWYDDLIEGAAEHGAAPDGALTAEICGCLSAIYDSSIHALPIEAFHETLKLYCHRPKFLRKARYMP